MEASFIDYANHVATSRYYRKAVEDAYPVQDFPQPPGVVMARIDGGTGLLAGPGSATTYFLPFKAGTQPLETVRNASDDGSGEAPGAAEDLLKQVF